jgi:hypothetical protein
MFTVYIDVDLNFIENTYEKFNYNQFDSFLKYNKSAITFRKSLSESNKLSITQQIKALPAFRKYCFYQSYSGCYINLLMDILTGDHYESLKQYYNHENSIQEQPRTSININRRKENVVDHSFERFIKKSTKKKEEISVRLSKTQFIIPQVSGRSVYNDIICNRYCSSFSIMSTIQGLSGAELATNMYLYLNYIKRNMEHNHVSHDKLSTQINNLSISISLRRSFCIYHLLADFNLYPPDIKLISLKLYLLVIVVCINIIQGMEADICYIVRSFKQNWKGL